jgi:hypothetical protein
MGHVYDRRRDSVDNDNDGTIDNETSNWSVTIKNLKISSVEPK